MKCQEPASPGDSNESLEPSTLYKYMDKNLAGKFFENCRLRACQPLAFNDPYDCAGFMPDLTSLMKAGDVVVDRLINNIMNDKKLNLRERYFQVGEVKRRHKSELLRLAEFDTRIKETVKKVLVSVSNNFGVMSFSAAWDTAPMWAHYAEDHQGVCFGYNTSHPFFTKVRAGYEFLRKVTYEDDRKIMSYTGERWDLECSSIDVVCLKSKQWEYEQEYRMLINLNNYLELIDSMETCRKSFKVYLVPIPEDAISEVIVGLHAASEEIKAAKKFAKLHGVPLYKSTIHRSSLRMDRRIVQ